MAGSQTPALCLRSRRLLNCHQVPQHSDVNLYWVYPHFLRDSWCWPEHLFLLHLGNHSKETHILHWHHNEHDPVGVVGNDSDYPAEREVLIPRTGSTKDRHHIEHLSTDKYNDHFGNTVHVHHVKRIPESEITKD